MINILKTMICDCDHFYFKFSSKYFHLKIFHLFLNKIFFMFLKKNLMLTKVTFI